MPHGKKCPVRGCGQSMSWEKEENQEKGRWVTYVCNNTKVHPTFREKVFETYKW